MCAMVFPTFIRHRYIAVRLPHVPCPSVKTSQTPVMWLLLVTTPSPSGHRCAKTAVPAGTGESATFGCLTLCWRRLSRVRGISRSTSETWAGRSRAVPTRPANSALDIGESVGAGFSRIHRSVDKNQKSGRIWRYLTPFGAARSPYSGFDAAPCECLLVPSIPANTILCRRQGMKEGRTGHGWRGTSSSPLP
jgi:hypothetical protein